MFEGLIITLQVLMGASDRREYLDYMKETFFEVEESLSNQFTGTKLNIEIVDKTGQKSLGA